MALLLGVALAGVVGLGVLDLFLNVIPKHVRSRSKKP